LHGATDKAGCATPGGAAGHAGETAILSPLSGADRDLGVLPTEKANARSDGGFTQQALQFCFLAI
jgi:hypothetical protein